ncbi:DUF2591 family protein [Providencia rettgeri]|nr:DUF2591 family protein [Providencia rettgeri]
MNKYTKLSDFEINELVSFRLGYIHTKSFDPCNNPAYAMPIIKDNLISLEHDGIAWMVSCVRHPEISVWDGCENYNDNFYRKAMELFLLMKDAENEG